MPPRSTVRGKPICVSCADAPPLRGLDSHGSPLVTFEHAGERWVVMRPVVEGMGLAWTSQYAKLSANPARYGMRDDIITHDTMGRRQAMTCIPLRRYPMWLATINPARIPSLAASLPRPRA